MKKSKKRGIKVEPKGLPKVVTETLKRIVFRYNPKFDGDNRFSCCELLNINGESWIVPREVIKGIEKGQSQVKLSPFCIKRMKAVAYTLEQWDICELVDRDLFNAQKAMSKRMHLRKLGLEVLKHDDPEVNKIHRFNYTHIINKMLQESANDNA